MWTLEIWDNSDLSPAWEIDTYTDGSAVEMPPSTSEMDTSITSNDKYETLYDGSEARIVLPTKYKKQNIKISISPLRVTTEMISKFNSYIEGNIGIRITTHTGEVLEGYFTEIQKNYTMSGSEQLYTIDISMKLFNVD